uniref:Uncharacterized protein n=1 Tax=Arundo donax TaxID=35708 RepID=A0A0A9AIA7_ARUDO
MLVLLLWKFKVISDNFAS